LLPCAALSVSVEYIQTFPSSLVVLKYIGYYAELPVGLPKRIEDQIVADMQKASSIQGM